MTTTSAHLRSRWWQPRSLTSRLVATTIGLVAVVSLLVAVVTTLALRQFLLRQLDDQLAQNAEFASRSFDDGPSAHDVCAAAGGGLPRGPSAPDSLSGNLDADCRQAFVFEDSPEPTFLTAADLDELDALPTDGSPHTVSLADFGSYRVAVVQQGDRTFVAGLPTAAVDATIKRLIGWESLVALLGVAAAAGAARVLVRRQLAPLREVAATAQEVTELPLEAGEVGMTVRVPAELTDPETEVGQVGSALNRMLSHVESALDARHESELRVRQFVADASHELRTPLSTIQGYAELSLHATSVDEATLVHAMGKVETESARMATLVSDLLLLARLDSGRPLDQAEIDLTHLVVEAVNDVRVVDTDRRWQLALPDEPIAVVGDEQRLHQVLSNLLSNARRHTGAGTTVTVAAELTGAGQWVTLTVHDDGPGLPESLRGKEFERFSRGDTSRARASGGAGLGLSIVKAIVAAHGGTVDLRSAPADTTVVVALPLAGRPGAVGHSRLTD